MPASPETFSRFPKYGMMWRRVMAELIPDIERQVVVKAVEPVEASVHSQRVVGVEKLKEVRVVCARALKGEPAVELVARAGAFVEARLQRVLMCGANQRDLIVVSGAGVEVRKRIEVEQGAGLGTDAAGRDLAAGKRQSRCRTREAAGGGRWR